MKTKKICLLVLIVALFMSSCMDSSHNFVSIESENPQTTEPANTDTEKVFYTQYLFENSDENNILIQIPVTDNNNVNQLILDYIDSYLYDSFSIDFELSHINENINNEQYSYTNYYIDIEYDIAYCSPKLLSIVFKGLSNKKSAAHPTHIFFTLNIDLDTEKRIYFKDLFVVDSVLYDTFANYSIQYITDQAGGKWPESLGEFRGDICSYDAFISGINNEVSFYTYFTNNGVGISYPVPFSIGNHKETEIPYSELQFLSNQNNFPIKPSYN